MVFPNHINYCGLLGPFFAAGKCSPQTIFMIKKIVFSNHINCYSLAKLFIVTGKWFLQTIIPVMVPLGYLWLRKWFLQTI